MNDAEISPEQALEHYQDWAARELSARDVEIRELQERVALLDDKLTVAQRRIRVLRGADVLTTASSRGVVIWLEAILAGVGCSVSDKEHTQRQLKALIETLEGA